MKKCFSLSLKTQYAVAGTGWGDGKIIMLKFEAWQAFSHFKMDFLRQLLEVENVENSLTVFIPFEAAFTQASQQYFRQREIEIPTEMVEYSANWQFSSPNPLIISTFDCFVLWFFTPDVTSIC